MPRHFCIRRYALLTKCALNVRNKLLYQIRQVLISKQQSRARNNNQDDKKGQQNCDKKHNQAFAHNVFLSE